MDAIPPQAISPAITFFARAVKKKKEHPSILAPAPAGGRSRRRKAPRPRSEVKDAAKNALDAIANVITNPEIKALTPELLGCMLDPSNETKSSEVRTGTFSEISYLKNISTSLMLSY